MSVGVILQLRHQVPQRCEYEMTTEVYPKFGASMLGIMAPQGRWLVFTCDVPMRSIYRAGVIVIKGRLFKYILN